MPEQWLTSSVVSRSFRWAYWGLWGPVPTVTVLKKGSSLEPAGSDLFTYLSGLISFQTNRRAAPSCAPDTLYCPVFTHSRPTTLSVFCQKHPLFMDSCWLDIEYLLHPHREGEPIRGCWPEAEEFGSEVLSGGEQQILDHHGQEAELSTSGKSWACWDQQHCSPAVNKTHMFSCGKVNSLTGCQCWILDKIS